MEKKWEYYFRKMDKRNVKVKEIWYREDRKGMKIFEKERKENVG